MQFTKLKSSSFLLNYRIISYQLDLSFILLLFVICQQSLSADLSNLVPLCGPDLQDVLPDSSPSKMPPSPARRDHVMVLPTVGESKKVSITGNDTGSLQPMRCLLRIDVCQECVVNIRIIPPSRFLDDDTIHMMPMCHESLSEPCFDLNFIENQADTTSDLLYRGTSIWHFEKGQTSYVSTGDSMILSLMIWHTEENASLQSYIKNLFPLEVTAKSSHTFIRGRPLSELADNNQTALGYIESPRYPDAYPATIIKRYTLINEDSNGFVRLIFDDFQLHYQSQLQIFESDNTELYDSKGEENRRPPAIQSKGSILHVEFRARDFSHKIGFRAHYEFTNSIEWSDKPNSIDCDLLLNNYGGDITMDSHVNLVNSHIDCIWIVERLPYVARTFDRIYLKVDEFQLHGQSLRLEVREGATSTADRLLLLLGMQTREELDHKQPRQGFTTALSTPAYYIRLRGFLMSTNGLRIVYAQFYRWATATCPGDGEYHCENARCIKSNLRCDGINHCGDATDEICTHHIEEFSKGDSFDLSGLIALIIGICGLIILLIATTTIMARIYRRNGGSTSNLIGAIPRRRSRAISPFDLASQETTAPSIQTVGERRFYVVPENQISVIEAPPCYNDALKHPAVPANGNLRAYVNQAFTRNDSSDPLSAPASPPPFDEVVPNTVLEIPESSRSTSSSSTAQMSPEPRGDIPEDPKSLPVKKIKKRKISSPKENSSPQRENRENHNVNVQVCDLPESESRRSSMDSNSGTESPENGGRKTRHEESWV